MAMKHGFSHRARRASSIASQIKKTHGEAAYGRYKMTGVLPSGTNERLLLSQAQSPTKTASRKPAKSKASGFPHPPFVIKHPLSQVDGLPKSVKDAAGDFITQATAYASDITPYEDLAQQTDPDSVSNILTLIMGSTTSEDERDFILAALGRIRGAMSGVEDPGPIPHQEPQRVDDIMQELGIKSLDG